MVTVWSRSSTLRARREAGAGWLLGVAVVLLAVLFSHGLGAEGGEGHHLPPVTVVSQSAAMAAGGAAAVAAGGSPAPSAALGPRAEAPPAPDHAPHDHEICLARAPQETAPSAFSCPLLPAAVRDGADASDLGSRAAAPPPAPHLAGGLLTPVLRL
ncbi:hypothetical protein [Streptomyces boninensis]|uniref:hypothetical protein n=1 Tax=Streptomyces boninensis TaxID=2039455 RepID=UPI003B218D31